MSINEPRLTLVMPAYNEEATIAQAIDRVLAQPFVGELIVVNDASTDSTAAILEQLTDKRIVVLDHPVNRGKGAAIRTGIAHATRDFVGIQDADLEYNPADLARVIEPLEQGLADVVYGSRFISGDARRVLYYWHSVGNRLLTLASNVVTNVNLSDMETCYTSSDVSSSSRSPSRRIASGSSRRLPSRSPNPERASTRSGSPMPDVVTPRARRSAGRTGSALCAAW